MHSVLCAVLFLSPLSPALASCSLQRPQKTERPDRELINKHLLRCWIILKGHDSRLSQQLVLSLRTLPSQQGCGFRVWSLQSSPCWRDASQSGGEGRFQAPSITSSPQMSPPSWAVPQASDPFQSSSSGSSLQSPLPWIQTLGCKECLKLTLWCLFWFYVLFSPPSKCFHTSEIWLKKRKELHSENTFRRLLTMGKITSMPQWRVLPETCLRKCETINTISWPYLSFGDSGRMCCARVVLASLRFVTTPQLDPLPSSTCFPSRINASSPSQNNVSPLISLCTPMYVHAHRRITSITVVEGPMERDEPSLFLSLVFFQAAFLRS